MCPVLSEIRPLPLAAERQPFRRHHLDLDVEGQHQREHVESRTEFADEATNHAHLDAQLTLKVVVDRLRRKRPAGRSRSEEAFDHHESR